MNDALHDLAKWVAQQQRTAFLEGAVHQATRINYDILDAIGEAARLRYPDPEPKAEPELTEYKDGNVWYPGRVSSSALTEDKADTCPDCNYWPKGYNYCATCGRATG